MVRLSRLLVGVSLTAAALTVPAIADASGGDVYTVQDGDTLFDISVSLGVSLGGLLRVNDLTLTSLIVPGQQLAVPGAANATQSQNGRTHRVVAGDTLSGIAAHYDVSLSALLAVNDLSAASLIMPGMHLALPAGAAAASASDPVGGPVGTVVSYALSQVGKPYVFFTKGPSTFDCSGLTMAAYGRIGVQLVHHAASQARQGTAVDFWHDSIRAGDLVFLDSDWDGAIDHVGMALGPSTWVQASQSHDRVMTGPLPSRSVIITVRRMVV